MMTKKTLTALGFILGSAFLTQANAVQHVDSKCLGECVEKSTSCYNTCNKPNNDLCSLQCLKELEKCFKSECGWSQWPSPSGPLSAQSTGPTAPAPAK